jgi:hypothetical protein
MADDPLAQLRQQLVDAGDRRAQERPAQAAAQATRRFPRRGAWLTLAVVLVAVPTGATAAGIIELGTSGTTPDGSTYNVRQITDAQASTDPAHRDGVGRTCETAEVRDRAGTLVSRQMACRPANAQAARPVIGAGCFLLPDDKLLVRGSVAAKVDRVTISAHRADIELRREPGTDRRSFYVIVPLTQHEIVATATDGRELGRTSINP